jgi:hypothetical protein
LPVEEMVAAAIPLGAAIAVLMLFPGTNLAAVLGALTMGRALVGALLVGRALAVGFGGAGAAAAGDDTEQVTAWLVSHAMLIRWVGSIATGLWVGCVARSPLLAAVIYAVSNFALVHLELRVFRIAKPVPERVRSWLRSYTIMLLAVLAGIWIRWPP